MNAIIVYSGGSNTEAVAKYIADKIEGKAMTVQEASSANLDSYDKIIVGTRVRAGKVPSDLSAYVSKNKSVLEQKSSAFYLCCMYNDDKGQRQLEKIALELGFSKYAFFNKAKKIVKEPGNAVDKFIESL